MKLFSLTTRKSAFTLIELLVVIAIIAILAAILFPVFGRARENARRSSCQSNLKQIGLGILQYVQDYDEFFPRQRVVANGPAWNQVISPYIKSTQLFACPSNTRNTETSVAAVGGFPAMPSSYACNGGTFGVGAQYVFAGETEPPVHIAAIDNSAEVLLVVETGAPASMFVSIGARFNPTWTPTANALTQPWFNGHLSTSNYLFADGHVKAMKPLQTLSTAEGGSGTKNMWTRDNSVFTTAGQNNARTNAASATNYWK